jgi:hypothetical protein
MLNFHMHMHMHSHSHIKLITHQGITVKLCHVTSVTVQNAGLERT